MGLGGHPLLSSEWNTKMEDIEPLGMLQSRGKDIVYKTPDEFAVVGVIGDPDVLAGIHAKLEVGLTETPSRRAVILQRAHDGMDKLAFKIGAVTEVPFIIVQGVVEVRHRPI